MPDVFVVPIGALAVVAAARRLKRSVSMHVAVPLLALFVFLTTRGLIERLMPRHADTFAMAQDMSLLVSVLAVLLTSARPMRSPDFLLGGFLVIAAVGMVHPALPGFDSALAGFRLTGAYMLAYFVGRKLPKAVDDLAASILYLSAPGTVLAIRQAVAGLSTEELKAVAGEYATYLVGSSQRLIGAMSTGQEFAFHLVLLAILALFLGVRTRGPASVVWYGILAAVILPLQFIALQRSALIAMVVGIGTFALGIFQGRRTVALARASIVLGTAATLLFVAPVNSDRLETAIARTTTFADVSQDSSLQRRLDAIWPSAVKAISTQPVSGNGPGSAGVLTVQDPDAYRHGRLITDNMFLHVTVQYGLSGILLFTGFLLTLYVRLGRMPNADAILGRAVIAGTLSGGLVGSLLGLLNYTAFAFLLLGSAAAGTTAHVPAGRAAPERRPPLPEVQCVSA